MEYVSIAAIAGCYMAIIALYVWVFKSIQEVKDKMGEHTQQGDIHVSCKELIFRDICDERVKRIEASVAALKENQEQLKELMQGGFEDVKNSIKNR